VAEVEQVAGGELGAEAAPRHGADRRVVVAVEAPHTGTPFDLAHTTGTALAVLVSRVGSRFTLRLGQDRVGVFGPTTIRGPSSVSQLSSRLKIR
jgi:hypothetical protein